MTMAKLHRFIAVQVLLRLVSYEKNTRNSRMDRMSVEEKEALDILSTATLRQKLRRRVDRIIVINKSKDNGK